MNLLDPNKIPDLPPEVWEGAGKAVGELVTKALIGYAAVRIAKYPIALGRKVCGRLQAFAESWNEPSAWHKKRVGNEGMPFPAAEQFDVHSYDLWESAIDSASRTDSKEHHRVLRDLIAKHLCSENDSRVSSSYRSACENVGRITRSQLYLLAVLVRMYNTKSPTIGREVEKKDYFQWIEAGFNPLLAGIDGLGRIDFLQLADTRCTFYSTLPLHRPLASLFPTFSDQAWGVSPGEYEQVPCWSKLEKIHRAGGDRSFPTPSGMMLGATHSDIVLGKETADSYWNANAGLESQSADD